MAQLAVNKRSPDTAAGRNGTVGDPQTKASSPLRAGTVKGPGSSYNRVPGFINPRG